MKTILDLYNIIDRLKLRSNASPKDLEKLYAIADSLLLEELNC